MQKYYNDWLDNLYLVKWVNKNQQIYSISIIVDVIILLYKCNKIKWSPISNKTADYQFNTYLQHIDPKLIPDILNSLASI